MGLKDDVAHMRHAIMVASYSSDPETKVGAIACGESRLQMAVGYNGLKPGAKGSMSNRAWKLRNVQHAEEVALLNAAFDVRTMYATKPPCLHCAELILSAGVRRVVTMPNPNPASSWRESQGRAKILLMAAGVEYKVLATGSLIRELKSLSRPVTPAQSGWRKSVVKAMPATIPEIAEKCGMTLNRATSMVKLMRKEGVARVVGWQRQAAIIGLGGGADEPRPGKPPLRRRGQALVENCNLVFDHLPGSLTDVCEATSLSTHQARYALANLIKTKRAHVSSWNGNAKIYSAGWAEQAARPARQMIERDELEHLPVIQRITKAAGQPIGAKTDAGNPWAQLMR